MKTTLEIADPLLEDARKIADRDQTTLEALVEDGLRQIVEQRWSSRFRLRKATFRGQGLQPDLVDGSWNSLRAFAYESPGS